MKRTGNLQQLLPRLARSVRAAADRLRPVRRTVTVDDRLQDAREAGSRMMRRAWGVTITGLLALQVVLQASGSENRWLDLINACLRVEQGDAKYAPAPRHGNTPPEAIEAQERLMGPVR